MAKKILALSVSVIMVMSLLCALPVAATETLPENLGTDYEPGERTGNMLFDEEGNFLSALNSNGHSSITSSATIGGKSCFKIGMSRAVNLTDQVANMRACSGATFSIGNTTGLYANLNPVWTAGTKLVFGATVMSTNVNYEPQINFGFFQGSYPQIMPKEYPSTAAGFPTEQGVFKDFGVSLQIPEKHNTLTNGTIMEFGFSNTTATQMEIHAAWDSLYFGEEYAYDIDVTAKNNKVAVGAPITVDADVLNQVGRTGYVSQDVTWYAMNAARTELVDGFTITEGEDGTATVAVDSDVASGTYALVAVADTDANLVKGIEITVKSYNDYTPGERTGNMLFDEDGTFLSSLAGNGVIGLSENKSFGGRTGFTIGGSSVVNLPNETAATRACSGVMFNKADDTGLYANLNPVWTPGTKLVFGADVMSTNTNYAPQVNFGFYQQSYPQILPKEYPTTAAGFQTVQGSFEKFGATYLLPESINGLLNGTIIEFGFSNTTSTQKEVFVPMDSLYLGVEYAYDLSVTASDEDVNVGDTFTVDADVLNQVGRTGYISQDVTWYAMNADRKSFVEGFTFTEGEDGTATVTVADTVGAGYYDIVAVADANDVMAKGVTIAVKSFNDYVPGERTGNMLLDENGNFTSSLASNGHSSVNSNKTISEREGFSVGMYKAVNLADKTANTRACSGAVFSLNNNGLYEALNPVWTPGTNLVFSAEVMSTNSNYEPQVNLGFYQASNPQIMPNEYPTTAAGFPTEHGVYKEMVTTYTLPAKIDTLTTYTMMEFGFSNTDATAMEVFVPWDSLYFGVEYAYDIEVAADAETISTATAVTVDADVLNQVGVDGALSQDVTWYAMSTDRKSFVEGFTFTEGANGTATVTVAGTVAPGEYDLVAVADANNFLVKGVTIEVTEAEEAPVIEDITITATEGGITVATDEDLTDAKLIFVTFDANGRMVALDCATSVTLTAQNTQEYPIPEGFETAKVMLWSDLSATCKPLADCLN